MKKITINIFLSVCLISCHYNTKNKEVVSKIDSSVKKENYAQPSSKWIGTWERNDNLSGATLEILKFRRDSFEFSMRAYSGGHSGELSGIAQAIGNYATFSNIEKNSDSCTIVFELKDDSIIVYQKSGICGAAMGVDYNGKYFSSLINKQDASENTSLKDLGVLETQQEDSAFRKLVGKDYDLFSSSSQLTSEDDNLDGFNAKVRSSAIRGLFTIMENIVMVDSSLNIWAAVIDHDKVNYYTNDKVYYHKLPKTIEKWRERFKEKKIEYKTLNR